MAARVRFNGKGVRAILNSAEVRVMLTGKADAVLAAARAAAPVKTGRYRDSLGIVQDSTDRAAVRVTSTAEHAMVVEANTGNLARALDAAGG